MKLLVQKLVSTARLPVRGSAVAAGYDLAACLTDAAGAWCGPADAPPSDRKAGTLSLLPGARALVNTGISITVPDGTYGRVAPRSGLAVRHGVDTLAGVVDQDYTGEVFVLLVNHGTETFVIEHGMRIAQLVIERIETPEVMEVARLQATARGAGGFGSTGC